MTTKRHLWSAALIAFLTAFLASGAAIAASEVECNNPALDANGNLSKGTGGLPAVQPLVFDSSGTAEITGALVNGVGYNPCTAPSGRDVDYYSFTTTKANQTFSISILNAYEATGTWIDLAVFGPQAGDPYSMYNETFYNGGSTGPTQGPYDPSMPDFQTGQPGTYVIGISSYPGEFTGIDLLSSPNVNTPQSPYPGLPGGTYTLRVTGAAPAVQQINIVIRPGRRHVLWSSTAISQYFGSRRHSDRDGDDDGHHRFEGLEHRFRHGLPVALLSSDTFDAMQVDQSTLTFGSTGDEQSLVRCKRRGVDVDHDGKPDLLCFFNFAKAGFVPGDSEGVVKGSTKSGDAFEGKGALKIVTGKPDIRRHDHDHDHDRDRHHHHRHH